MRGRPKKYSQEPRVNVKCWNLGHGSQIRIYAYDNGRIKEVVVSDNRCNLAFLTGSQFKKIHTRMKRLYG